MTVRTGQDRSESVLTGGVSIKGSGVGVGTVGERCWDCSEEDMGCSAKSMARKHVP